LLIADMKGMVAGKKVEVIYADHQNKADVAANKAREWIDTQGLDLLIGAGQSHSNIILG
jgi:branched-chain amino acid transport system substrate-binding protein